MKGIVNIGMYQLIWFLCVFWGNPGALGGLAVIVVHLIMSDRRREDLRMAGFLLFIGLVVDGTLVRVGFFSFATPGFPIPFWLMVIWLGLAITPNHSLAWMKHKPLLCLLFGALGGPVAYWAGVRLGAAEFQWGLAASLALLAIVWALLWTAIMHFSAAAEKKRIMPLNSR